MSGTQIILKEEYASALGQTIERRQALRALLNNALMKGVDYGEIPGTDKPTLLKPGAEKILQFLNCAPDLEISQRIADPQTGYFYVEITARARSIITGAVIGTGVGSCNSYESKYRWRWEWWNAPGTPPAEEGWEVYRKGGRVTYRRRVENRDLADTWNTVLKMAKKRALVDLALSISGASELFTQDIDDFVDGEVVSVPAAAMEEKPPPKPAVQPENKRPYPPEVVKSKLAATILQYGKYASEAPSDSMRGKIISLLEGIVGEDGRRRVMSYLLGIDSTKMMNKAECMAILKWLAPDGSLSEESAQEVRRINEELNAELAALGAEQQTLI